MKRTISVLACLAVFCTSHLVANNIVATIQPTDLDTFANNIDAKEHNITRGSTVKKGLLLLIPTIKLDLITDEKKGILKVSLVSEVEQNLEWVIFQPKGAVISRLSTSAKINEIKISHLQKGTYVLMIKDEQGRAIFKNFKKE